MKNTLMRNMLRSAVFLLLLALMLSLLSVVFRPKNNNHDAGMYYIMAHGFLAERERSIDVLILGDSEFSVGDVGRRRVYLLCLRHRRRDAGCILFLSA